MLDAHTYLPIRAALKSRLSTYLLLVFALIGLHTLIESLTYSKMNPSFLLNKGRNPTLDSDANKKNLEDKADTKYNLLLNEMPNENKPFQGKRRRQAPLDSNFLVKERAEKAFALSSKSNTNIESPQHFPYRYLINEENACNDKVKIINVIPITPENKQRRSLIRKLWGSPEYLNVTGMKTLFLVGLSAGIFIQPQIEEESRTFHDIIQLDFVDSYKNLCLKTLSILHWSMHYCPSAKWILKSDDDVFINPFALRQFLEVKAMSSDFICKMNKKKTALTVCRYGADCPQKWAVPEEQYPFYYYPRYCNGPAYVMSAAIIPKLFERANKTHPYVMEDVYFTGILAMGLKPNYRHLNYPSFPSRVRRMRSNYYNGVSLMINIEGVSKVNSNAIWKNILQYRLAQLNGKVPVKGGLKLT